MQSKSYVYTRFRIVGAIAFANTLHNISPIVYTALTIFCVCSLRTLLSHSTIITLVFQYWFVIPFFRMSNEWFWCWCFFCGISVWFCIYFCFDTLQMFSRFLSRCKSVFIVYFKSSTAFFSTFLFFYSHYFYCCSWYCDERSKQNKYIYYIVDVTSEKAFSRLSWH